MINRRATSIVDHFDIFDFFDIFDLFDLFDFFDLFDIFDLIVLLDRIVLFLLFDILFSLKNFFIKNFFNIFLTLFK